MLQEAQAAQLQTNSYKLDKNHIFMVSMFDDFEKYAKVPEEYALAEKKPYVPRVLSSSSIPPAYWVYHHRALQVGLQWNSQTACYHSWLDTCCNENVLLCSQIVLSCLWCCMAFAGLVT